MIVAKSYIFIIIDKTLVEYDASISHKYILVPSTSAMIYLTFRDTHLVRDEF